MSRKFRSLFVLILGLFFARSVQGDTVTLKSGRTLKGVILKETETEIILRLKVTTTTINKNEIRAIERTEVDRLDQTSGERIPSWDRCIQFAAGQDWVTDLQPIPATVIDKGVLKNVPYKSFRSGLYEINIYGDPDHPAGFEIGIGGDLLRKPTAKSNCVKFVSSLLRDTQDKEIVRQLDQSKDKKERTGLTFEITPETDEDAYGDWWVSAYDMALLDKSRASDNELKNITVSASDLRKRKDKGDEESSWRVSDLNQARNPGGPVYVKGYIRKDGTYVQPYTRSAPSSGRRR